MKWILGVAAAAVIVGLAATMTIPAQTVTPDQTILKLFPAETQGIGSVDVAALRNAPLFNEFVLQRLPMLPQGLQEFAQATGFEIQRDVDKVTAGRLGKRDMLVIVQARYDPFKLEQYIKDKGGDHVTTETYLGRTIYTETAVQGRDPQNTGGFALIDNLIVAGSLPAVKAAIDRMAAPAPNVLDNADLMGQIRTIEASNQIWAVGKFDPDMVGMANTPNKAGEFARSLSTGAYQMRIDQDVHIKATGVFTSPDVAKAASDMARGFLAMAKLQVAQQDDLTHLLDGVNVDYSGATMTVSINASGVLLKQLHNLRAIPELGIQKGR